MVALGSGGARPVKVVLLSRYACYLAFRTPILERKSWRTARPISPSRRGGRNWQTRASRTSDGFCCAKKCGGTTPNWPTPPRMRASLSQGLCHFSESRVYGALRRNKQEDIHRRKGLKSSQMILDHMGSTELAANLFRATQAEEKLRRRTRSAKTPRTGRIMKSARRCGNHPGVGRHNARKIAGGGEHQEDRNQAAPATRQAREAGKEEASTRRRRARARIKDQG